MIGAQPLVLKGVEPFVFLDSARTLYLNLLTCLSNPLSYYPYGLIERRISLL
jgi:hypothetical protein